MTSILICAHVPPAQNIDPKKIKILFLFLYIKQNLFLYNTIYYLISDRFLNNAGKFGTPFIEMSLPPRKHPPWKDPPP